MKNLNYFSNFGKNTATLAGLGRYLLYHGLRGTLPREEGVQEFFGLFFNKWSREHPKTIRAFYAGTKFLDRSIWRELNGVIRQLGAPVPTCFTNDVQLYSLNGSGDCIRWFEVCMYINVAKTLLQSFDEKVLVCF